MSVFLVVLAVIIGLVAPAAAAASRLPPSNQANAGHGGGAHCNHHVTCGSTSGNYPPPNYDVVDDVKSQPPGLIYHWLQWDEKTGTLK